MNNFRKYIRSNKTLVEIIISLIGILSIIVSGGLMNSFWKNILSGIGISVFSSSIVVFLTDAFLGSESNDTAYQWGLVKVYKTRGEMNKSCDDYLAKAKRIDIIAFGLKSLRDSQQKSVERILKKGGCIRIITMEPECLNLTEREKDENREIGNISHSIEQLLKWAKVLNLKKAKKGGKIEIRFHNRQPLDFMFLMDNRLFTGPYEYGKDSQQTLSFEYNTSGTAYGYYQNYFNDLWENQDFCKDALNE